MSDFEQNKLLGSFQRKLPLKLKNRKSDQMLGVVTELLENHGNIGLVPVSIQDLPENRLEIFLGKNKEFKLSKFLPEGLNFQRGSDFSINKLAGKLEVPTARDKIAKPLRWRIALAHEIGHSLDPDYEQLDSQCQSNDGSLQSLIEQENSRLRMEVNAWNYGKAVADVMGLDEAYYEEMMHLALLTYQMSAFEKIAISIGDNYLSENNSEVQIYNPITQELENGSIKDLIERIQRLYETDDIFRPEKKIKQLRK